MEGTSDFGGSGVQSRPGPSSGPLRRIHKTRLRVRGTSRRSRSDTVDVGRGREAPVDTGPGILVSENRNGGTVGNGNRERPQNLRDLSPHWEPTPLPWERDWDPTSNEGTSGIVEKILGVLCLKGT